MAGTTWTTEQKKAIDDRDKGIIVSAAAGSGKTTVLIERMIRLLSDEKNKIPADRLLAVTFTKEAASSMKEKLSRAFDEQLRSDPENKWLLSQQNLIQLARISTINSFCLDLVKNNLHEFDFQGGLDILDDNVQKLILQQSLKQAYENLCENNYDSYKLLKNAFSDSTLQDITIYLYNFMRSLPFPERWIADVHKNFTDDEIFESFLNDNINAAKNKLKRAFSFYEVFEEYACRGEIEDVKFLEYDNLYVNAESDRELLYQLRKLLDNCDINAIAQSEWKISSSKPFPRNKKFMALDDEVRMKFRDHHDMCVSYRASYTSIIKEIIGTFTLTRDVMKENMLASDKLFGILCDVCKDIDKISHEMKLERNGVTFSDVEIMARVLLVTDSENGPVRTELCEEIRKNRLYELIFIDEFQDVNNLQELVFRSLSDSDDLNIMGKNVFVVGDIKQAIYRFRLSNPELFSKTRNDALSPENSEQLESITLSKNFRSRESVVDFVNYLFHYLMTQRNGQVDYDDNEELRYGELYDDNNKPTEIMLIKNDKDYKKVNGYSVENTVIAQRIKQMLDSGEQVLDHGVSRSCRAGDFCILVQENKEVRCAAKALEAVGLKAYSEDTYGYIKSREITLVLNMLRMIDNPMNDIAMTAVMMSPIMGFTPDEMAEVTEKAKIPDSRLRNHIYQIIAAAGSSENGHEKEAKYINFNNKALQDKCREFNELINSLRYLSMSMGLERLIRKIYDMTDLMGIVSLYLDADKKRANLRLLLEYAASYEHNSQEGVTGFLRYIDSVSKNEKAFKQAMTVTEGSDSVYIKTYHASKGLEYPFVFLSQLDIPMLKNDSGYCSHNKLGFAFRFMDNSKLMKKTTLYYDRLSKVSKAEEKSEKLRLLYVGCTRAKERLFISFAPDVNGKTTFESVIENKIKIVNRLRNIYSKQSDSLEDIISDGKTMLDWILAALAIHSTGEQLTTWFGTDHVALNGDGYSESEIVYNVCDITATDEEQAEEIAPQKAECDESLLRKLMDKFSFEYDRSEVMTPAKMTVTEITAAEKEKQNEKSEPEFYPNLPRLDDELDKLSAAEKGTFTHKFMELADYDKAHESVKNELERLVTQGFFSKKESEGVYTDAVEAFFSSDFYDRMKKSDNVMREKKFLVSVSDLDLSENLPEYNGNGGMLQGIADCIFHEPDGYVIVDYKTDRFKDISQLMGYKTQLALYKAAFEIILGEKIKSCYIYSFWLRKGVEIKL